jgi:hypothetical protein
MNISREMSMYLPCDVQRKIWQKYTQKYIIPELLRSNLLQSISKRHDAFEACTTIISNFVYKARIMKSMNNNNFQTSIDVLEDRILDDEWFPWDTSRASLQAIILTKQYISHPELLKVEIETNLLHKLKKGDQMYILASNLAMLTKMLY